jgi:hypothetical protein
MSHRLHGFERIREESFKCDCGSTELSVGY